MEKNPSLIRELGIRLFEERKRTNFTQKDIADAIGVSSQWYGKVERGLCRPSIEMLYALEEMFDFDITYIITGKNPPQPKGKLERIVDDCPQGKRFHIEAILHSAKCLYTNDE